MLKNMWKEMTLSVSLVALLLLFINPFEMFGMPTSSQMILLGIFNALFMVFIAFSWQENPQDEREMQHTFLAGRVAFLAGTIILVVGMVVQIFLHTLDIWIPIALGVMILSKMISLVYFQKKY
ncbi:MAG: hypothetical protein WCJ84_01290 [Candidatus Peregrinibacteria bacterium]